MDNFQAELLEAFREESAESILELLDILQGLQGQQANDDSMAAIDSAFRIAHNVKGAARVVGLTGIEETAHGLEDTLSYFRDAGIVPSGSQFATIQSAVALMEALAGGGDVPAQYATVLDDLQQIVATASEATDAASAPPEKAATAAPAADVDMPDKGPEPEDLSSQPEEAQGGSDTGAATTVRVSVDRLDRLMGYTGELLTTLARLESRNAELEEIIGGGNSADLLPRIRSFWERDRNEVLHFSYLTEEIGNAMMRVRMVPLSGSISFWRQVVREAATETGKQVKLDVVSSDIEIDKYILDGLRDPLMHVLRNAVDHGIETEKERKKAKKEARGLVQVRSGMIGAQVCIEVSDDGRGINLEAVRDKAVALQMCSEEQAQALSDEELRGLLCKPGFTTRASVNKLSGRGVGLDVVNERLRELGGSLTILPSQELGGTTIRMQVPASVVSTRGLMVRSGTTEFAFPVEHVAATMRIETQKISNVDGGAAVQLEGQEPLRLRWLANVMQQPREPDQAQIFVVVLAHQHARVGMVVDEVVGVEKFVTKHLPWNVKALPGISGAVLMEDGKMAVVLDVPRLLERSAAGAGATGDVVMQKTVSRAPRILVVDDSLTSRTLERNILKAAGYDVTVAEDGELAWQVLQNESFDLVVSDVEMPNLDGLGLTRRIRQDETHKHVPLILVTSLERESDLAAGAEAGANEYIVKGRFDQRQLLEAVAKYV